MNQFKVGDTIQNLKTGKIGIVTKVYKEGIIKYHLIGTPNNIHTFAVQKNRFIVIDKREYNV